VKKLISIVCLVALLLSTSSLAYFYWLQEQLHESKVFAQFKAGTFKEDDICHTLISLEVKDKFVLPEGYTWEEEGREFTYQGMLYDIVAMEPSLNGWKIKAISDEEEAIIVSNKSKTQLESQVNHKTSNHGFKINIASIVFDFNATAETIFYGQFKAPMHGAYIQGVSQAYFGITYPPPQFV
jgi:hypothetical protein